MLKIVVTLCLVSALIGVAQSLAQSGSTALTAAAYDPLAREALLRNPLSTAYPSSLAGAYQGRHYSDPSYLRALAAQTNYLGRPESDFLNRDYLHRQSYNSRVGQYPGSYNSGAYNSGAYNAYGGYPYNNYNNNNYGQYPYNQNQRAYGGYNYNTRNALGYGSDGAYDSRFYS